MIFFFFWGWCFPSEWATFCCYTHCFLLRFFFSFSVGYCPWNMQICQTGWKKEDSSVCQSALRLIILLCVPCQKGHSFSAITSRDKIHLFVFIFFFLFKGIFLCILEHIGSFHPLVFAAAGAVQLEKDALCSYLLLLSIIGVFFHNLHPASLSYFLTQRATECIFVYPSPFSSLICRVFFLSVERICETLWNIFFFLVQTSAGFWAVSTRKFRIDLF